MSTNRITIKDFKKMKREGKKITMLTAYSYPIAKIIDEAGAESILVGDSLGMTIMGYENTLKVTLEDSIRICQAVTRAANRAFIIGDMPFLSYGITVSDTIKNAGRLIKEGDCQAVKLEGGKERLDEIEGLKEVGIPVLGHIGLTPSYINLFGGYKIQGKSEKKAKKLLEDAKVLEEAGVFAIVLEGMPWKLAKQITEELNIPTIGIGAGEYCDGQVLVIDDLIGLTPNLKPKFVKKYSNITEIISKAVKDYIKEVKEGEFPSEDYRYD